MGFRPQFRWWNYDRKKEYTVRKLHIAICPAFNNDIECSRSARWLRVTGSYLTDTLTCFLCQPAQARNSRNSTNTHSYCCSRELEICTAISACTVQNMETRSCQTASSSVYVYSWKLDILFILVWFGFTIVIYGLWSFRKRKRNTCAQRERLGGAKIQQKKEPGT